MNDRELLELAATAVGYDISHSMNTERLMLTPSVDALLVRKDGKLVTTGWNPLIDDGDALRLAVELKLAIFPPEGDDGDFAVASVPDGVLDDFGETWIQESVKDGDKLAATRRAIVCAAAEIGKAMPHMPDSNHRPLGDGA
ncbi:MAG: hypothetical protein BWY31_02403 [Lentisphaerae bacterium ADurb.Bin242]|nr:MAG: hypothetical protein BWY31_02403 [Lentisphaerae bacterium ADurb.Bin242]